MTDQEFQLLDETMGFRLVELQAGLQALGRPVLLLLETPSEIARQLHLKLAALQLLPAVPESLFSLPRTWSLQQILVAVRHLPRSGELAVWHCPPLQDSPAPAGLDAAFAESLVYDGVLLVSHGCAADTPLPDCVIALYEHLIDAMEQVMDPEMMEEGQEDHEAEALQKRLDNPGLDSLHRHAPPVPRGCRSLPTACLPGFARPGTPEAALPMVLDPEAWNELAAWLDQPSGLPPLVVCVAVEGVWKDCLRAAPAPAGTVPASLPRRQELLARLAASKLPQALVPADRSGTLHHLSPVWNLLEEWLVSLRDYQPDSAVLRPDQHVLVLEEAWYTGLKAADTRFGLGNELRLARVREIRWMETLLAGAGIRVITLPCTD